MDENIREEEVEQKSTEEKHQIIVFGRADIKNGLII